MSPVLYLLAAELLAIPLIVRRDKQRQADEIENAETEAGMARLRATRQEQLADPETLRFMIRYQAAHLSPGDPVADVLNVGYASCVPALRQ